MKSALIRTVTLAVLALAFLSPIVPVHTARAADSTFSAPTLAPLAEKGFKVVANTSEATVKFRGVLVLSNAVISAISFPTRLGSAGNYSGDSAIVGKTLTAGVFYPVYGDTITLASGSVVLIKR